MNASPPAPRLAGFLRDALAYAASPSEAAARRLVSSPFSSVARAVARAFIAIAGEHGDLCETIAAAKLSLAPEAAAAARRFSAALNEIAAAGAAGSSEETLGALVRRAFNLDAFDGWNAALSPGHALGPHPIEGPSPVARRQRPFSASSLGMYAECERKWYYRYVCAAVEDKGSSASAYGSAFHSALEQFHREYPRADAAPAETLGTRLDGWIQTAFERYRSGFETNVEYDLQVRRARRTAKRYLAWFLRRAKAHPFSVVDQEAEVALEMDGYSFTGFIDRLDRDDKTGNVTVVDYKTGSIATSAAEYRAKISRFVDFQLPFYYWARTALGDRVTRLALVPLKDALRDVEPIELEVVPVSVGEARRSDATTGTIGIDELERAKVRMIELARRLSDEPLERFPVTDDPDACTFCAYVQSCRSRPLRRDARFGNS
jgi:RecB family exonuclease